MGNKFFRDHIKYYLSLNREIMIPAYYQVSLKLFGTLQVIFFLTKFFEFFRAEDDTGDPCELSALRSANYQSAYDVSFQVYDLETVSNLLKKSRTFAICHVFFAFCSILLLTPIIYSEYNCQLQASKTQNDSISCGNTLCQNHGSNDSFLIIFLLIFQASYAMSGFLTLSLINNFLNQNVMLENFLRLRMPNREPSSTGTDMIVTAACGDAPPAYDELSRLKVDVEAPPEYSDNKV